MISSAHPAVAAGIARWGYERRRATSLARGSLPYRRLVEAGLPLSLNTDDPGLFVSSLPGEFSAMYGALAAAGMEHRQILRWLDERIGDARHASFLSPQVPIGAASPVLEPAEMNALFRYQPGG